MNIRCTIKLITKLNQIYILTQKTRQNLIVYPFQNKKDYKLNTQVGKGIG